MKRAFIPGAVDRHGIAHPLPECRGGCSQGRAACDCGLASSIGPDASRVIRPSTVSLLRRLAAFEIVVVACALAAGFIAGSQ